MPFIVFLFPMKHFLKETDFKAHELAEVFALARDFKAQRGRTASPVLAGQTWALLFSKSSTRTRVSFEVGIHELGGNPLFLNRNDLQLGRGESVEDTARVLSRFVHGLIVRTYDHSDVLRLAATATVPVVNALTDFLHPCQIYSDAFTAAERWSPPGGDLVASLRGRKVAYLTIVNFVFLVIAIGVLVLVSCVLVTFFWLLDCTVACMPSLSRLKSMIR